MAYLPLTTGNNVAIDLGSGCGVESAALLSAGWEVFAIDREPMARQVLLDRILTAEIRERVHFICSPFEELTVLPRANLFFAYHSIPFCRPSELEKLWQCIGRSVLQNGIFAAGFFGPDDDWVKSGKVIGFDPSAVMSALQGFECLDVKESCNRGLHLIDLIALKEDEGIARIADTDS